MEFQAWQHRISQLSARLNLMVVLVFGLLLCNGLLGALAWYTTLHQRIEITPFFGNGGYLKSETAVDAHFLSLMSENFIYSRLNVTPETVTANHERLLSYVDATQYKDVLAQLQKEKALVIGQKISSHFEITGIRSNPQALTADISGVLKRSVGLRVLDEHRMTYQLAYRYRLGRLSILRFSHVLKETSHD